MGTVIKRWFAGIILAFALVFFAGMACVAPVSGAYAAQVVDASAPQGLTASQSTVVAQDLTAGQAAIPAPTNRASQYEVYSTYFFFNAGLNACAGCNLYMDYRVKGGAWQTTGYMYAVNDYTIKGLRPNKTYQARLYYKSIYTDAIGAYSPIVTFKTGPKKKPAIKSVSVRAVKLKKHWQKVYGYVIYLGKRPYYTYKIQTTVTLKKKPKAKYITICGKRFKANKKKYTVTTKKLVRFYNSPVGKKYSVTAYTSRNKTWKGYSLLYKKNFKIR